MKLSLKEVKEALKSMLLEMSVVKTNKGILQYDGEELAVDLEVKTENEKGEIIDVEDGDYELEDGRTLVIEGGKIKEIIEKPEVEETEPETEPEQTEEMEEIVEPETEQTEPEQTEEAPEKDEKDAELEGKIAELEGKIAELEGKIAELLGKMEKFSTAKPATEEFENVKTAKKTGDAKLDRFLERYGK